jgi:hypothetical protein
VGTPFVSDYQSNPIYLHMRRVRAYQRDIQLSMHLSSHKTELTSFWTGLQTELAVAGRAFGSNRYQAMGNGDDRGNGRLENGIGIQVVDL